MGRRPKVCFRKLAAMAFKINTFRFSLLPPLAYLPFKTLHLLSPSSSMEFWGVEVKAGKPIKVVPEEGKIVHISQAALGDLKGKVKGLIPLRVKIEDKEFILGSLSAEIIPQVSFDLVFDKEFELSHDCKNGSVYFCGYLGEVSTEEHDDFPYDSEDESLDSEDELPVNNDVTNGKLKPSSTVGAKPVEKESDDSSDDDMDESDEDDDSEDEETPKKINNGKKIETASKILPVPSKKAKAKGKGGDDNCGCGHAHAAATKRSKPAGKTNSPALLNKSKKAKHGAK